MKEQEVTPTNTPISWSGSFPQNYEDNLKFIFGPYAEDMAKRVVLTAGKLLELACGTGQVTQRLAEKLNAEVAITATDLSPEMMAIAKQKVSLPNMIWEQVDMCNIPYDNEVFDVIICQFGLMFAPDKVKAVQEMHRVLKKGGSLILNTWGLIEKNKVLEIFNQTLINLMNFNLGATKQGPFSMQDEKATLEIFKTAGFKDVKMESVSKTGVSPTAAKAAKGFFQGSQLAVNLKAGNPALGEKIQATAEQEFINQLGDLPLHTPLQAWVFTAFK